MSPPSSSVLPIDAFRDEIIRALQEKQVLIVAGDTGCGKTTRLPLFCRAAGLGMEKTIGCTQPRRIAAWAMAARVREEIVAAGGDAATVGCKVRFHDHSSGATRIKFMTDGILLAEMQTDPELWAYDGIIVDEVHERSLNIDLLLGSLRLLCARRADLRVVLASATIETGRFAAFFGDAPVITVAGGNHPVEIRHWPVESFPEIQGEGSHVDAAVAAVGRLHQEKEYGDILIFMPTETDIRDTVELLRQEHGERICALPLFGRLPTEEQRRIFQPAPRQKIVVATNVAETSITVPGIRAVIDSGLARLSVYSLRSRTATLPVLPVSQASCRQRAGRCGRTGPGICIRLFGADDYESRPAFTRPEIQRANLASVVLRMLAGRLGRPEDFPFPDPPLPRALRDARELLAELGAVDREGRLTAGGRIMSRLPLDPCIARILVEASRRGALAEACVLAAALSLADLRIVPPGEEEKAKARHTLFASPDSDFVSLLLLWEKVRAQKSRGALRRFCQEHYLSFQRTREWLDIHDQIRKITREERGFVANSSPASYEALHRSLASGFLRFAACRKREEEGKGKNRGAYQGIRDRELWLHPGSWQRKAKHPWIIAADLVQTSRLYARIVARVEPGWLEDAAGDLLKSSASNPHWSRKQGCVIASQRRTLFGLPVVVNRSVNLGKTGAAGLAAARRIFIENALVPGDLAGRWDFLDHNLELVDRFLASEEKLRSRGYVADEEALAAFYDRRLPAEVSDAASLRHFSRRPENKGLLFLDSADVLVRQPDEEALRGFPEEFDAGGLPLPLSYCFAPGQDDDGVTVRMTPAQATTLTGAIFEWLVPGLLAAKIDALLRGLPKALRKKLVPVQQSVCLLYEDLHDADKGASMIDTLARAIRKRYGIAMLRSDLDEKTLPPHLRMRFLFVDAQGLKLAAGRNLAKLVAGLQGAAEPDDAALAGLGEKWERDNIRGWDFSGLDAVITLEERGRAVGRAFPALVPAADGASVGIRLFRSATLAMRAGRAGLACLYSIQFGREARIVVAACDDFRRGHWRHLLPLDLSCRSREALLPFVLDGLFATADGGIPSLELFGRTVDRVRAKGLEAAAGEVLESLGQTLALRDGTVALIQRFHQAAPPAAMTARRFSIYQEELEAFSPRDFLCRGRASALPQQRRMLQALRTRIERAHADPARDLLKQEKLDRHRQGLDAGMLHRASAPCGRLLEEYLRMLDEFFISLFAQEMGTLFPVSEKRLERKWQEIAPLLAE